MKALGFGLLVLVVLLATTKSAVAQAESTLQRVEVADGTRAVKTVAGSRVELSGSGVLLLQGRSPQIGDGQIHFAADAPEARIVFDQVRPSVVQEKHLSSIFVNGEPAVHGENVRLVANVSGTIVVPHGPDYEALLTYNESNLEGTARRYIVHQYYKSAELGEDEDRISSLRLKKGYMATLAENEDGTGASRVFIARSRDLEMGQLPADLAGKVSFIRVFPWRYTGKKGFGGKSEPSAMLDSRWHYDWSGGGESTLDMEFVPMRHNARWDSFEKINELENVTHLLGFNEPNQPDQANMTVQEALDMWPKLQASGLRLGSPSPNDAQRGLDWLYEFMDGADERGYRVDFVAVHYYKADWPTKKMIGWLRDIHLRTGRRPIWLTEFNNGAPWSKDHDPSYAENARQLAQYCRAMDSVDFVERYAVFNLGPDTKQRQLIKQGELTPAGEWYEAYVGDEAYTE